MPASYTATVTAKSGPGVQNTAVVITGVTGISYDFARNVVQIFRGSLAAYPYKEFELQGVTTITTTPSTGVITIS